MLCLWQQQIRGSGHVFSQISYADKNESAMARHLSAEQKINDKKMGLLMPLDTFLIKIVVDILASV